MSIQNENKINWLLKQVRLHAIISQYWLNQHGYSRALVKRYVHSSWLSRVGHGAYIRTGDVPTWQGAIYTLQTQLEMPVHLGAKTALSLHGKSHYIAFASQKQFIELYVEFKNLRLPSWLSTITWENHFRLHKVKLFSKNEIGLDDIKINDHDFNLKISSPERAIMEMLAGTPDFYALDETYKIMQGLISLRIELTQKLLENCLSYKTKRLFLLLAELSQHKWFKKLDLKKINLGIGKRSIAGGGKYYPQYLVAIPLLENADLNSEDIP